MEMVKHILVILAAAALSVPALSARAQTCSPVPAVLEQAAKEKEVIFVHVASPVEVRMTVDLLEAILTDLDVSGVNTVVLATIDNGRGVTLFGKDGVCYKVVFENAAWRIFLRTVIGGPA